MKTCLIRYAAVLALTLACGAARADLVTYTETGTASGVLNGNTFTDVAITVVGIGDTADITSVLDTASGVTTYFNPLTATAITFDGLGSTSLTGLYYAYNADYGVSGAAGFAFQGGPTFITIQGADFGGYGLDTSFAATSPFSAFGTFLLFDTAAGGLVFTDFTSGGTFTAEVRAVPEPASLFMLGTGLVGLMAYARCRRTRAA